MVAAATPPWTTDESIPPQPLRPAPLPMAARIKSRSSTSSYSSASSSPMSKQDSLEPKSVTSAPAFKSIPRPIPRKQLSAPAGTCQIPLINPPNEQQRGLQKIVKDVQTNPFLNGLMNFEAIKTNFFSTTVVQQDTPDCKIVNEQRATKSAIMSKNPFRNSSSSSISSCDNPMFDFNPTAIKSIMEEAPDDGYEGDNDDCDDPLKQLEARIQKLEASNRQRRRSNSQSPPPRFSPKVLNKPSSPNDGSAELAHEKFIDTLNDSSSSGNSGYRKHIRNRSYSENEATSELNMLCEQDQINESTANAAAAATTNPFTCTNGKRPLLKTPSETYLEQYSTMMKPSAPSVILNNNKTVQLCKHPSLTKILQSSSSSLFDGTESAHNLTALKRTISSESISSDSSVIMSSLERSAPPITGNLCIALQYDK
jgi:hypothetical protein